MFAYCENNPVIYKDKCGEFLLLAIGIVVVGSTVVGGFAGGIAAAKGGGNFWHGFLEGALISGGSSIIGLTCGTQISMAIGLSIAYALFTDLVFQCEEAVSGNSMEFDAYRWVKAGIGAPINLLNPPKLLELSPYENILDAIATVFVTKVASVLYGLFDIATTPYPETNSSNSSLIGGSNMPVSQSHQSCFGSSGSWVLMCQ